MEIVRSRNRVTPFGALALAAALALAPAPAGAGEAATSADASLAVASRYVWRGQTLSEGFVAQPSVTATWGGFSANLWANIDLDAMEEDDDDIAMNETDLTLSYDMAAGPVLQKNGKLCDLHVTPVPRGRRGHER